MALESPLLLDRLGACVMRAGGKRALAAKSGISEAQLYRYLNGESSLPTDRLVAIANAVEADAHWLLSGEGGMDKPARNPRPPFDPMLLHGVVREFESLLLEYEVRYTPDQRAHAINLMYEVARLAMAQGIADTLPTRIDILHQLDFSGHEQRSEIFKIVGEALNYLEYGLPCPQDPGEWQEWLNRFDTLMAVGHATMYNAYSGELYFGRMNGPLPERAVKFLLDLVVEARTLAGVAAHSPCTGPMRPAATAAN